MTAEAAPTTRPLNATAASLLGFLHAGPMTGWDLVATAETRIGGFWSLTRSQVYRELASMAEAGLVVAGETGARDRRPYELSAAGREAFAAWALREPGPETIRFPLLLAVGFGRHVPADRLATYVHRHRAVHAARLVAYEQAYEACTTAPPGTAGIDAYGLATLSFGLRYERAVLAWFDDLPPEIRGSAPWGDGATD